MPMPEPKLKCLIEWSGFKTFGDPGLELMLSMVAVFIEDIKTNANCPWLVLLGTPGIGKSFLARRAMQWWRKFGQFYQCPRTDATLARHGEFVRWSDFVQECREGDSSRQIDMLTCDLLILDDIGAGCDTKAWTTDKLYRILEHRLNPQSKRATFITANQSLQQLAEIYDQRIASRLLRRGTDRVIVVDTVDYALRDK